MRNETVLQLTVNNHAGVMSHVTGLFARRAFNIQGILCGPIGDGDTSCMMLLVNEDERLDQLRKQLEKLHDVIDVAARPDYDKTVFYRLDQPVP